MTAPVFRFAPSPNGELHLGHAFSALLNQQLARSMNGRLLLRMEDIDIGRCTPEFEQAAAHDLAWLGVEWERPVRRQSEHFTDYERALDRLRREGLVYPAFMSRGEIRGFIAEQEAAGRSWPRDPDGVPLYPGIEKTLGRREREQRMAEGNLAWRLDMDAALAAISSPLMWREAADAGLGAFNPVEAQPRQWGDVIVARKDIPTSYHLAVVVDDCIQGVTHVVRGRDLYAATAVHRVLQYLLDLPAPAYHHHRLLLDSNGQKLSKSTGATGLRHLRERGHTPEDIRNMVGLD